MEVIITEVKPHRSDCVIVFFKDSNTKTIKFTFATNRVVVYLRKKSPEFTGFSKGQIIRVIKSPYKDRMGFKITEVIKV